MSAPSDCQLNHLKRLTTDPTPSRAQSDRQTDRQSHSVGHHHVVTRYSQ